MIKRSFLRAAVLCLVSAWSVALPASAQPSLPRACARDSYPPVAKPCHQRRPCINEVPPTNLLTANDFQVTFTGIICFAGGSEGSSKSRQAMMIHGNFFTKRHTPKLGVYGADEDSLRRASGRSVECDNTYCWTSIRGLRLRIVDDDHNPPNGDAVDEDPSFCDLVPRLKSLLPPQTAQKYALCGDDQAGLPKSPVDACFDLDGGSLIAYPFKSFRQGRFVFSDGHQIRPLQFADVVAWYGHTNSAARLQIKSMATGNEWRTVKTAPSDKPLLVAVANLGHAHHTTTHFVLNEKLYGGLKQHLPAIVVDQVPPCDPDKTYCYTSLVSLVDVAGCSNTRP